MNDKLPIVFAVTKDSKILICTPEQVEYMNEHNEVQGLDCTMEVMHSITNLILNEMVNKKDKTVTLNLPIDSEMYIELNAELKSTDWLTANTIQGTTMIQ